MREGRHKVAEDFAAVAADLVNRGITTVAQLGAQGGSNGGLLMGIMLTQYPERFGALVCSVPLLDMRRYHLLLAGASWMAEYGDPDNPDDWAFISEYSPYQNISATRHYPPVLITTSTRDDRVHPGHARKMTAALQAAGHRVWLLREHRGRARRRGRQPAGRVQVGAEPIRSCGGCWRPRPGLARAIRSSMCQGPNASNSPCWRPD